MGPPQQPYLDPCGETPLVTNTDRGSHRVAMLTFFRSPASTPVEEFKCCRCKVVMMTVGGPPTGNGAMMQSSDPNLIPARGYNIGV